VRFLGMIVGEVGTEKDGDRRVKVTFQTGQKFI
jgi:hypothetical protein